MIHTNKVIAISQIVLSLMDAVLSNGRCISGEKEDKYHATNGGRTNRSKKNLKTTVMLMNP